MANEKIELHNPFAADIGNGPELITRDTIDAAWPLLTEEMRTHQVATGHVTVVERTPEQVAYDLEQARDRSLDPPASPADIARPKTRRRGAEA